MENKSTSMIEIDDDEIVFNGILSKEQVFRLHQAVKRDGKIDEDEAEKLVLWAIEIRTGAECLKMLMEGLLSVNGWKNDEPQFGLPEDDLEFINTLNLEMPTLEESRCY